MTKKPEKQMSKSKPASSFKLFIKLFKDYSGSNLVLWLPIFLGLLLAGFITGGVWLLGYIIDNFLKVDLFNPSTFSTMQFAWFIVLLALFYFLQKLTLITQYLIVNRASVKIGSRIRVNVYQKLQIMPLSYFENEKTGDLMSTVTNDIQNVVQSMIDVISNIITVVFTLVITFSILISYSFITALIALVIIPINFIPVLIIIVKNQKYFVSKQQNLGNFNAYLEEIIDALPVIRINNKQSTVAKDFDKINKTLLKTSTDISVRIAWLYPWFYFSKILNLLIIVGLTVLLKNNWTSMPGRDNITSGSILSISIYVFTVSDKLGEILEIISNLQLGLGSVVRVKKLLDLMPLVDESKLSDLIEGDGTIEFKNVWFAYPSNPDKYVLKDISFKIEPTKTLALVGHTGCGKSTIAKLLSKLYVPTKGDILINGQSIFKTNEKSWRNNIDVIQQETYLFKDAIKNNLSCVRPNISDEQLISISEQVGLDEFVKKLPDGYKTELKDNGSVLSVGQKQLIAITRSMISSKTISILDEATSDIDTLTESKIKKAISLLSKNKTLLIIAHRLSTIKNADNILMIENGEIKEQGTHNQLMSKQGLYQKMYLSGFEE
ncbi:ABC transporter ATP-binding protein [Mycoplasma bovis]|uniref:ABC transporter ATP-binding protein n=1 Tax=Mycoplasmopsis bovis TaxID=28903 RepID=UPI001BDE2448|nr:ABC transporter ATP-binding protein [Mycoplasmopsis bovis]MBT1336686.1 ABC transporter ATP-binding protein [Mycoplasmopsis bovis]MBT1415569.1 ABC transporter ATP-binding protein [Mycoplasmopsis bovis]MBT1417071.1 ABC transporter ATP-binding protein [Mycoplasmopsis bovis]UJB26070.1 ABC transporter ATP-binding protein [Mycoplasmopsis bovis]